MKAMIFAAGEGRRLAPLTDKTPKPLLPVRGVPLIERQLQQLAHAGITDVVINLYHLGDQIRDHLGNGERLGVHIHYSPEATLMDTGGGLVNALPLLGAEPFLILNGDIYTDFPFQNLPTHLPGDRPVHIVVVPTPSYRDRGDFEYANGRITGRGDHYVYCGIAVMHPRAIKAYPLEPFSLAQVFFNLIDAAGLSAEVYNGTWVDIGTPAQYAALNKP